jgi:hypothetical protein
VIREYSQQEPPGAEELALIRTFVEQQMLAATVVMPFSYYQGAQFCTVMWEEGKVEAVAYHHFVESKGLRILQIMGTFVAPTRLRKGFTPLLLQRAVVESHLASGPLHWCFRTRNPLTVRATKRHADVFVPLEDPRVAGEIAKACYGGEVSYDEQTHLLRDSYPASSEFLRPSRLAFSEIDYNANESLFFSGLVDNKRAHEYLVALGPR